MGTVTKIAAGIGVLAGISYFGKSKMRSEHVAAKAGGLLGYLKGMGQGFYYGARTILRIR